MIAFEVSMKCFIDFTSGDLQLQEKLLMSLISQAQSFK